MARHTATEVARNFASFLDRVQHRGERVVIQRRGVTIAELVPVSTPAALSVEELVELCRDLPHLGPDDAAAFGETIESGRNEMGGVFDPWA